MDNLKERTFERQWAAFKRFAHCLDRYGREDQRTLTAKFWHMAWEKAAMKADPNHMSNLFPI